MAIFDFAFSHTLTQEGGHSNDPDDPGGETRWGISKKSYPQLDIENLSAVQAREIYHQDFWIPLRLDDVGSQRKANAIFDVAVNLGKYAAVRMVQKLCKVPVDGLVGIQTIQAINDYLEWGFIIKLAKARADYYVALCQKNPTLLKFLSGWLRRTIDTL